MDCSAEDLHKCFHDLKYSSDNISCFVRNPEASADKMLECSKALSDFQKACQSNSSWPKLSLSLSEVMHVKNFDFEQLWQIFNIEGEHLLNHGYLRCQKLKKKTFLGFRKQVNADEEDEESVRPTTFLTKSDKKSTTKKKDFENEINGDSENEDEIDDSSDDGEVARKPSKSKTSSSLDDGFFILEDMNKFLEMEDRKEERRDKVVDDEDESSDEIDYFDEESDEEETSMSVKSAENARTLMFNDFYDAPNLDGSSKKKIEQGNASDDGNDEVDEEMQDEASGEDSDEDSNDDSGDLDESDEESKTERKKDGKSSTFELEENKMKQVIKKLEEENLAKKPWQVIGEVSAAKRPKNSLLEENLTFDQKMISAPTITEETTETLEDLIKQRIKDEAWDDVIRKVKPVEKPYEYKKSLELNQEKSKISLAEVYEKEYIKQTEEVDEAEENPEHEAIKAMMDSLFSKLNALSNFTYTPKQPKPELKIISNVSSLQMEECTPVTTSNEQLLAPEEIYDKKKAETKGESEKTSTDKKHERRDKKALKKQKLKQQAKRSKERLAQGKGNSDSKLAALKKIQKTSKNTKVVDSSAPSKTGLKSSAKFFDQLQENVEKGIRDKSLASKKRNKDESKSHTSHMKL